MHGRKIASMEGTATLANSIVNYNMAMCDNIQKVTDLEGHNDPKGWVTKGDIPWSSIMLLCKPVTICIFSHATMWGGRGYFNSTFVQLLSPVHS